MSGKIISTGMLTNNGKIQFDITKYLNLKIKDIVIHIIPLSTSKGVKAARTVGLYLTIFLHSSIKPSLTHIAIQLNLENCNDVIIIEYGQYYSENSNLNKNSFLSSLSKNPRESKNDNIYYYINKDGARLTLFSSEYLNQFNKNDIPQLITRIIAAHHYNISLDDYEKKLRDLDENPFKAISDMNNSFYRVECNIKNIITLEKLIKCFKSKNWEAEKYNVLTHNCQKFGAEIIKILNATRKHEEDKVRIKEKLMLPGCIISALWDNEELSKVNTLGRIPIFGYFHDLYQGFKMDLDIKKNQ